MDVLSSSEDATYRLPAVGSQHASGEYAVKLSNINLSNYDRLELFLLNFIYNLVF